MNQHVGIISDQEIGCQLARTLEKHEISVSVYPDGVEFQDGTEQALFCNKYNSSLISVMLDMESFLMSLESPRRIFLASDRDSFAEEELKRLIPHLEPGDILIDLCDVKFNRVPRRVREIKEAGAYYLSTGILQGDTNLPSGISLLPGGAFPAYDSVRNVLMVLSAKMDGDFFCCPYIGPDGSGQYVKMVHDGLSHALLEIYAEAVTLTRTVLQCSADELAEIITEWNSAEAGSYLLDVINEVVRKYDGETGAPMLDIVMDMARSSSGAAWMIENAVALSVPVPTVYASLAACSFSQIKNERIASSKLLKRIPLRSVTPLSQKTFLAGMAHAMHLACLCVFAQGFALLKRASDYYAWELNLLSVAKTFQGSSYVRAEALYRVIEAFERKPDLNNLFTDPYFKSIADRYSMELRDVSKRAVSIGFPAPGLSSCVTYLDSYRSNALPAGLSSLVWDYVLDTGFERSDRTGLYHGDWRNPDRKIQCESMD